MLEIAVNGIEFYGFHGVPDAERQVGHRFMANVLLRTEARATETDEVQDTIDYGGVAALVERVGTTGSVKTVERLAQLIGEALINDNPTATEVTIELLKLLPPVPLTVASAGVRLTLRR